MYLLLKYYILYANPRFQSPKKLSFKYRTKMPSVVAFAAYLLHLLTFFKYPLFANCTYIYFEQTYYTNDGCMLRRQIGSILQFPYFKEILYTITLLSNQRIVFMNIIKEPKTSP